MISNNSFYHQDELKNIGFKTIGENILISKKVSFYGVENIAIGNNVRIDDFCILSGEIKIGSYVHIAPFSALFGGGGIELQDFSGLSSRVSIYSVTDNYLGEGLTGPCIPMKYRNIKKGNVVLKKHAVVGASTVILPNTVLNEGTAIGAHSLVKGIIPAWSIFVGVPAKFKKRRKEEIIKFYENEFLHIK